MTLSVFEGYPDNAPLSWVARSEVAGQRVGAADILLTALSANHQSASIVRPRNCSDSVSSRLKGKRELLVCVCVCVHIPAPEVARGSEVGRMQPLISSPGGASLSQTHTSR